MLPGLNSSFQSLCYESLKRFEFLKCGVVVASKVRGFSIGKLCPRHRHKPNGKPAANEQPDQPIASFHSAQPLFMGTHYHQVTTVFYS